MNNHAKSDWHKYNQKLINRRSLTFWLDQDCLKSWMNKHEKKGLSSFSNLVIQAGKIIKSIYRLSLRSLEGFLDSIPKLFKLNLKSPKEELAGFVSEGLRKQGIETVLVGGACVTIYSKNRYQSYDLDCITYGDIKKVRKALQDLAF